MADILIRGMEMPPKGKSICIEIFGAGGVHKFGECYPCALAYEVKTQHGRLIDADVLYEIAKTRSMGIYGPCDAQCVITGNDILEAPTIVPAEGDKEHD